MIAYTLYNMKWGNNIDDLQNRYRMQELFFFNAEWAYSWPWLHLIENFKQGPWWNELSQKKASSGKAHPLHSWRQTGQKWKVTHMPAEFVIQ